MKITLSGIERLYLWCLFLKEGEGFVTEQIITLNKKQQTSLTNAGLVELEKKKNPATGRQKNYHVLTEAGWGFLAENPGDSIVSRSTKASLVMSALLQKLDKSLQEKNIALVDFFYPSTMETEGNLTERIHEICLQLAGGQKMERVRIADLRKALVEVPREQLDNTLREMVKARILTLVGMDDPLERTQEDDDAAFAVGGIGKRHLIYLEK